jgi:hypothetical protein
MGRPIGFFEASTGMACSDMAYNIDAHQGCFVTS